MGDQAGDLSCAPVVCVIFLGSPFSAGKVIISPLKPNTTRAPVGEISALLIWRWPCTKRGRSSSKSAAIPMVSLFEILFLGSKICKYPACSKIIFPLPDETFKIGKSSKCVNWFIPLLRTSYKNKLNSPFLSLKK